jgi:hypothetical protein
MNGRYFDGQKPLKLPQQVRDLEANRRAWQLSEAMTGLVSGQQPRAKPR